jgi:large subunit ribosomal protein L46
MSSIPATLYQPSNVNIWQRVTFFFKAHVMAGQVRLDEQKISDFAWLTKQEITSRLDRNYWLGVKDMLSNF